ncbi:MAG: MXAN_2562 family outer membrane beta-barrel protein, partial [Myxococcota bacterium]|nr:MXAN_2562 family outer membrane beta-barrel protein [Myxococcota bacterium]
PCLRRVRRPLVTTGPIVGVLAHAPGAARADDFTPYWEDPSSENSASFDVAEVKWHAGIRVGPYIPEIDLQAGLNALTGKGPYAAMFGDYYIDGTKRERAVWQILPMLDVDRILWSGFGQVGVGGSIGYMQKSAYAYLDGTSEDDEMRPRSRASRNTFRLLPLAVTVSYRFTWLDDTYGIPVVPYVRGGLSYYAWWIRAPNGNVSRTCEAMDADMCTSFDKAYGGSIGYQGSVGLAIRAERIDAEAAMSMRNSGIQHAGFYGEYQYAKVDGFGSETRLSVGDNTWFAGVNFEF